jgi:probable phosphoglycerate mutase
MNVFIVRHGDDDERYRGGWSDLPLVDKGIEKCEKLASYMYNNKNEFPIERIISSDLKRAKMTAEIINEKYNVPIFYDNRLRENNNGIFAGMLNEEAEKNYPHAHFSELEYDEKFPEGESPKDFFERIKKDFFNIIEENKDVDNLLIVTHGGVISIVRHIVNNINWSNKNKGMKISKTSISKLVVDKNNNMKFEYENITPHIDK